MIFFRFITEHKWKIAIALIVLITSAITLPIFRINSNIAGKIFTVDSIPNTRVAIVFGAAIYRNEIPSDVLADRIKIATTLYNEGKIEKILMTGGNPEYEHNEPEVMKNFAINLGVPEDIIYMDYAGFRTYDSCARANAIFGIDDAILVTQKSHLPRAIFLCEKFGIKSIGVESDLQTYKDWDKQILREMAAKIFAFWEVNLFEHEPKYLGEEIKI